MSKLENIVDEIINELYDFKKMDFLTALKIKDQEGKEVVISKDKMVDLGYDEGRLLKKLEELIIFYSRYKLFIAINSEKFNDNYNDYLLKKLSDDLKMLNALFPKEGNYHGKTPEIIMIDYYNDILSISTDRDIFEIFAFTECNRIVFGRNGSGKTRLLNKIRNDYNKENSNVFVMPSNREISIGNEKYINIANTHNININDLLIPKNGFCNGHPNDYLTIEINNRNYKNLEKGESRELNGKKVGNLVFKIIEIFNSLGMNRRLDFSSDDHKFKLYSDIDNIDKYDISEGSDGERAIFQIIAYTLICKEKSYLLIDEPENHLNTALLKELFDELEKERKDIIFIYFSHNVDFIQSRNNVKYVYLEKYDGMKWSIQEMDSFDEISIDIILKIVGSKKDILFIEGEEKKLDYKLYSLLFPEKNVIPVGSCENVISKCKALKTMKDFYSRVSGIVDNDFRDEEEILALNKENINVLQYNEIENILLSSIIIKLVFEKNIILNGRQQELKDLIIAKLSSEKNVVFKDYAQKYYNRCRKTSKLKYDEDYKSMVKIIDEDNKKNKNNLIDSLKDFESKFNVLLSSNNYDDIIKKFPNKGLINEVKKFGIDKNFYYDTAFAILKDDKDSCRVVRENLF